MRVADPLGGQEYLKTNACRLAVRAIVMDTNGTEIVNLTMTNGRDVVAYAVEVVADSTSGEALHGFFYQAFYMGMEALRHAVG